MVASGTAHLRQADGGLIEKHREGIATRSARSISLCCPRLSSRTGRSASSAARSFELFERGGGALGLAELRRDPVDPDHHIGARAEFRHQPRDLERTTMKGAADIGTAARSWPLSRIVPSVADMMPETILKRVSCAPLGPTRQDLAKGHLEADVVERFTPPNRLIPNARISTHASAARSADFRSARSHAETNVFLVRAGEPRHGWASQPQCHGART